MEPLSLIMGGASLLGSIFSSDTSAKNTQAQIQAQQQMQQQSQAFNAEEAAKTRDWQTQMSNTAYQRSRQDMEKAGLNPILAAGAGGSSTPSGATASTGTPTVPTPQNKHPLEGIGNAVGKMIDSQISMKTMEKMTEEIANLKETQALTAASTAVRKEEVGKVAQETRTEKEETLRRSQLNAVLGLSMPGHRVDAKTAEAIERMPDWLFNALSQSSFGGRKVSDTIKPVSDLVSSAASVKRLMPSRSTSERTDSRTGDSTFTERWDNLWR